MINFTLTITAAPELLAAISNFTNSIKYAKVVTIPEPGSDFKPVKSDKEQVYGGASFEQQAFTYPAVEQQMGSDQQLVQNPTQPPKQAAVQTMLNLPTVQAPMVPTSNRTYTMQQLAVAATQLVDAGRRSELVGLLNSFGVQAMTALPREQYGAFATQLRAFGAKI